MNDTFLNARRCLKEISPENQAIQMMCIVDVMCSQSTKKERVVATPKKILDFNAAKPEFYSSLNQLVDSLKPNQTSLVSKIASKSLKTKKNKSAKRKEPSSPLQFNMIPVTPDLSVQQMDLTSADDTFAKIHIQEFRTFDFESGCETDFDSTSNASSDNETDYSYLSTRISQLNQPIFNQSNNLKNWTIVPQKKIDIPLQNYCYLPNKKFLQETISAAGITSSVDVMCEKNSLDLKTAYIYKMDPVETLPADSEFKISELTLEEIEAITDPYSKSVGAVPELSFEQISIPDPPSPVIIKSVSSDTEDENGNGGLISTDVEDDFLWGRKPRKPKDLSSMDFNLSDDE